VENRRPNIFGPQGGLSRVFAINEVSFNAGLMLGPLLSGILSEEIGYYKMSVTLSKSLNPPCWSSSNSGIAGLICLANAIFVWNFFERGLAHSEK